MPIDPTLAEAMIGPFRGLLDGVAEGEDAQTMRATLAEMEALARQMSDAGEFSAKLANEGYYQRFTDAYTRAMQAAAGAPASGSGGTPPPIPDDATLLAQSLQAYETSLSTLRDQDPRHGALDALERILAIGRSGVTYPVFLRLVDEEGLTDALAGSVTPRREDLVHVVEHHRATIDPAREVEAAAVLAARDALALASPTGAVDPFTFELERFRIAHAHAPAIALRDAVVQRLPRLLDLVIDWLDAHTTWAPADDRFRGADAAATRERIAMARECNPGFYAVRAAQFAEMFGPAPWWERPELAQERAAGRILWTDDRLTLALDAVPSCVPMASAPPELVARAEAFGPNVF